MPLVKTPSRTSKRRGYREEKTREEPWGKGGGQSIRKGSDEHPTPKTTAKTPVRGGRGENVWTKT